MAKRIYLVDTENVNSAWKSLLPKLTKNDRMILFYTANSPYISYGDLKTILAYPESFEMMECYTGNNGLDFQLVSYMGYLMKTATKTEYVVVSNDTGYDAAIKFWRDRERVVLRMTSSEILKPDRTATKPEEPQPTPAPSPRSRRRKRQTLPTKQESAPTPEAPKPNPAPEKPQPSKVPAPGETKPEPEKTKVKPKPPLLLEAHKEETLPAPAPSPDTAEPQEQPRREIVPEKLTLLRETLEGYSEEECLWVYEMLGGFSPRKLSLIYDQLVKHYGQDTGLEYYKLLKPILRKFYAKIK